MPPKQRITREMILERSFEMFCRDGMEVVNARSVAKALNCSTQPIFSYFSGMEDLKNALEEKAKAAFEAVLGTAVNEDEPVVAIGSAYTRFAAEQPRLFTHLLMSNRENPLYPFMGEEQREQMVVREMECTGLEYDDAKKVCVQMSIYIHGLATIRAAQKAEFTPEEMEKMVSGARDLLIRAI